MSSFITCDLECVCSICQDLLTENPEDLSLGPTPAKRSKPDPTADSVGICSGSGNEPQPSTSTAAGHFPISSTFTGRAEDASTPELCTTPCGHIFHKHCLLDWTKRKRECPTCRKKVNPVYHVGKFQKLTRVFLPLTPGQCRQCKERVRQIEAAQLEYVLEKSRADDCEEKEKTCREHNSILVQENEKIKEKVDELNAEVYAVKVDQKLQEHRMIEEKLKLERRIGFLQEELNLKLIQLMEKEENEVKLLEERDKLKREKENLVRMMSEEKKKALMEVSTVQEWKRLYQLAILDRDRYKSDRDYERGRANLMEEWYQQMREAFENGNCNRSLDYRNHHAQGSLFQLHLCDGLITESSGQLQQHQKDKEISIQKSTLIENQSDNNYPRLQLSETEEEDDHDDVTNNHTQLEVSQPSDDELLEELRNIEPHSQPNIDASIKPSTIVKDTNKNDKKGSLKNIGLSLSEDSSSSSSSSSSEDSSGDSSNGDSDCNDGD